jgi:hypothetical protein
VLERKLFTPPGATAVETVRPHPDWMRIHAEMRRPGVTLLLLWEERHAYRQDIRAGFGRLQPHPKLGEVFLSVQHLNLQIKSVR